MRYINIIALVFSTLLLSCNNEPTVIEDTEQEVESSLLVSEILKNNPAVEVGEILTKKVTQKINCTGNISIPPTAIFSIHSKSEGIVSNIKYLPGDYVKKGTLLCIVNNPALVEKQRLFLETKVALDLAKKDWERKKILHSKNATTQKEYDEALANKDLLAATYQGLKSELNLVGINAQKLEEEQAFQSNLYIYAPQSGHITRVMVHQGQMISPQNSLMEMANQNNITLELSVLSKDIALLEKGQEVTFFANDNSKKLTATIHHLAPMINAENGALAVYCTINKEAIQNLTIGMFVQAEIQTDFQTKKGVPLDAVIKEGENYFAYFEENNKLIKTQLQGVRIHTDFVSFDNIPTSKLVTKGAYYIE